MKKNIKILVNFITTFRLIGAFILMCIFHLISKKVFFILLLFLFATDFIDGFLARKYHVETFYGSLMDTLADKTLNICLIVPLLSKIPFISIVLILEVIIMFTNLIGKLKGKKISTEYIGKVKMWFVAFTIILGYFHYFNILKIIYVDITILVTSIIQIATITHYIIYFKKQKSTKKYFQFKNKKEFLKALFDTDYYLKNN
jgi:CDP-diacylglycerol--glycerol-3-phosphate 3-phosphatidyltransferase